MLWIHRRKKKIEARCMQRVLKKVLSTVYGFCFALAYSMLFFLQIQTVGCQSVINKYLSGYLSISVLLIESQSHVHDTQHNTVIRIYSIFLYQIIPPSSSSIQ